MSWDQDPYLDPSSNNDLDDTDFNATFEKGILAQDEYLKNNPSSSWWFRDPYSERLAAEKLEYKKAEQAKTIQKDSSSPFYDLSDRIQESGRVESITNKKNSVSSGANLSPSYSPSSISDIRGNSLETFMDLEYTDKFTRSPEYDPSIPEPPKKIIRSEIDQKNLKKNNSIPGLLEGSLAQKANSSDSTTEAHEPGFNLLKKMPPINSRNSLTQKLSSSNKPNLKNDSAKETNSKSSTNSNLKESSTRKFEENIDLSIEPASTREDSQNDPVCDHWGTSAFSWDSPPRVSSKPTASWDSPPHVPSKPTASWNSPPHAPSKPTAFWVSPPRVPPSSKIGSFPVSHKNSESFTQSSLQSRTISKSFYNSKAVFSSKPNNLNDSKNNNQALKPGTGFSGQRPSGNNEQKPSYAQAWEDGFLEAATLLLDNIPSTYYNSCIDLIRKKHPHVIIKNQLKKPRLDSCRPSFVSSFENLAETSRPSTHQPSPTSSNSNDLNINQLNYMRRLQAMESNVSLPQSSITKNHSLNSVSSGPQIRNNSMGVRPKTIHNSRGFHNQQINHSHPHPSSSQRGRPRNGFRPYSQDYNPVASKLNDSTSFDLLDINTSIIELIMSEERFLNYEKLPIIVRNRVVRLAKEYGLKAHCTGSGANLSLKLEKVGSTCIPANTLAIQALLATPLDDPIDIVLLKKMMSAGETQWHGWPNHL